MANTELQKVTPPGKTASEPTAKGSGVVFTPRVDVVETADDLLLYAELPGVKPDDVSLTCKGDQLILHARCAPRGHGKKPLHAEYGVGDFYRAFTIAEQVERDAIEASLKDGVLVLRVPKAEAVRPKRIAVKGE
jgi:HSP20 family protein